MLGQRMRRYRAELAAALRYFCQYLAEDDPGRKDMLIDIASAGP
jgi:Mn-containing catalase